MSLLALFAVVSLLCPQRPFSLALFCCLLTGLLVEEWREVDWREWQARHGVAPP